MCKKIYLSNKSIEDFKWPISVSRLYNFSSEVIWEKISQPGNLENFHPFCIKNTVEKWPSLGSKDSIHYHNGLILNRYFIKWKEKIGYDLIIKENDDKQSFVSWRIHKINANRSKLKIIIYPYLMQNFPTILRWLPYKMIIIPSLNKYLESVLKGLEYYLLTNKPVKINQFGKHSWFSIDR